MKLKFTIADCRLSTLRSIATEDGPIADCLKNRKSQIANRKSDGIALVLTLILLSVTLVMAVAFLLISTREQGSVTTQTDAATSRYAADAALAGAQAQIAANILAGAQPDLYNYGLLVSTNDINPNGWAPGFNNVNYDFDQTAAHNPLTTPEFLQNLTNLFYDPRPPVFFPSATNANVFNDFRYYLDLNRNGRYDTNGMIATWVTNSSGQLVIGTTNFQTGDPEWIGVLEQPDKPYGPNNHFVARYAYIAIPIDNTLDLNAIHNQTLIPPMGYNVAMTGPDAFFRNQGVGSWEINLAAFLADLNTNQWGQTIGLGSSYYFYDPPPAIGGNQGYAFADARALLAYRYAFNYDTLLPAYSIFTNIQNYPTNIDVYSDGGLQTTVDTNFFLLSPDNLNFPFAGADNTNRFFDLPTDLFDATKSSAAFVQRLTNSGSNGSTYDRYTFYRLLSQLGADSEPESGKINLNYSNAVVLTNASGMFAGFTIIPGAETNLTPWQPIQFFTIAADSLLRHYTAQWAANYGVNDFGIETNGALPPYNNANTNFITLFNGTNGAPFIATNSFGIGNIPVYINGHFVYTPAVNRLLQLAANIYDATQTNFYPHIFRPMFTHDVDGDIYIAGYAEMTNTSINQPDELNPVLTPDLATPIEFYDFTNLVAANTIALTNIYGVPWIIGAKKGFPNFNELSTESAVQMSRKLEGTRDWSNPNQPDITWTNQMYLMNFTNYLGFEFWNSYRSNYLGAGTLNPGLVDVMVRSYLEMAITNSSTNPPSAMPIYYSSATNWFTLQMNLWHGWNGIIKGQQNPSPFVTWTTNINFFSDTAAYAFDVPLGPGFYFQGSATNNYPDLGVNPIPHLVMFSTNRLQAAIIDYSAGTGRGRIIDYVQLGGLDGVQDLTAEVQANDKDGMFDMTYTNGVLLGVYQQIHVSMYGTKIDGSTPVGDGVWKDAQIPGNPAADPSDKTAQQAFFRGFFATDGSYSSGGQTYYNTQTNVQAPYTPTAMGVQYQTWQANDPLVHYLASDLTSLVSPSRQNVQWPENIGLVNDRYKPWGQPLTDTGVDPNPNNLSFKDPLVSQSDNWNFPTNPLPTVGWLGRVHRGTPWQTVYLKSTNILNWVNQPLQQNGYNTWSHWTGDGNSFDVTNMAPTEDRLLFDLFTTAPNDNATRGQLSVNTPANDLAAWSAVFSGIEVIGNTNVYAFKNPTAVVLTNIQPAGPYDSTLPLAQQPPLVRIVSGINQTRTTFKNADGLVGVFEHKGDILATPQLSDQSPFIYTNNNIQLTNANDQMFEWLPQQAMSLLSGGNRPVRYMIYSWGQTLQPAPGGTYLGSDYFGMVTNYQVTAETATRAIVRVTPTNAVIESFNVLPPD